MNSHDCCHTPLKRACLPIPALSHSIFDCSVIIITLRAFVKCFISFWPDVPSLFYLRFVPISGIIPVECTQGRRAKGLPKFFVSPDDVRGRFLTLDGENAAHAKVLRLRRGDSVLVCDGCGTDYRCTVSDCSPQQVCLVINSTEESGAEPPVACSVYMDYEKDDKLEHVI